MQQLPRLALQPITPNYQPQRTPTSKPSWLKKAQQERENDPTTPQATTPLNGKISVRNTIGKTRDVAQQVAQHHGIAVQPAVPASAAPASPFLSPKREAIDRKEEYNGPLVNGKRHGDGDLLYSNGDRYSGPFVDGQRHGFGTYFYENGDRFIGEFKNDISQGKGTLIRANGDILKLHYQNAKGQSRVTFNYVNENVLEAEYDEAMRGQGTLIYANRDKYVGEFLQEFPHGFGTLTYADGSKFVGEFIQGRRGTGTSYNNEGSII